MTDKVAHSSSPRKPQLRKPSGLSRISPLKPFGGGKSSGVMAVGPAKMLGSAALSVEKVIGLLIKSHLKEVASGQIERTGASDLKLIFGKRFDADEMGALVIPHRTMVRRIAKKEKLTQEETDKAMRLARVVSEADRVFGNPGKSDRWLRTPIKKLANQTPLGLLRSEAGALLVDEILGQIDHGMFA